MKKTIKSIMMCVLVLMMCFTFANTAQAATDSKLYILGQEVTGDTATGDGWRFERAKDDESYHKLYLTNANLVVDDSTITNDVEGQAIHMWANLEIILSGNNSIIMNATDVSKIEYYEAIDANNLILSGNGTLDIKYNELAIDKAEILCIYINECIEIKENVKLNIQSSALTKKDSDSNSYIEWYGLIGEEIIINSNSQVNISLNKAVADEVSIVAIYSFYTITLGNNVNLSIDLGKLATNSGLHSAIQTGTIVIGDDCKLLAKAADIEQTGQDFSLYTIVLGSTTMQIGDRTIAEINSGTNGQYGFGSITLTLGKDSIIKSYGEKLAFMTFPQTFTLPIYGGNKKNDVNPLTLSNIIENDYEYLTVMYGDTPAKYVEIGDLLTIKLNCDNGIVDKYSLTMHNGHAIGTLPTPVSSRKDYTFAGWYTAPTGGNKIYSTTKLTQSTTLYAQWKKITYTITLNANGGSVDTSKFVVESASALGKLPTPTRAGYTFTGWYTAKTGGTKVYSTTKPTKSMTLYAQWKLNTYTIKFDGNGGTVGVEKKWVDHGNAMEFMPTPKREGYTFTGWFTAATGGNKVYSATKVTKNMTLYAQWKLNTYTIKFDGNGGTVGVEKKWVDHGNAMNFMPTPKRDGYTFTGWFTAKTGGSKVYSTTKVTKNMTLYAQWKKK